MIDLGEQPDGWVYFTELVFVLITHETLYQCHYDT